MKKLVAVISFVILSMAGLSAQVSLDSFIDRIYYGMTEDDLIREFGDAIQHYNLNDTTVIAESLGPTAAIAAHAAFNLISQPDDIISNVLVNIKIGEHILLSTFSTDSLSRVVNSIMVMPSLFDYIDGEQFNDLVQPVIGKPDSDGKYYLSNCVITCPYPPFMLIKLTDHKLAPEECVGTVSLQNIQDEFFGIPMYASYFEVKNEMSDLGYYDFSLDRNELLYKDVDFAGLSWDYCRFTFNDKRKFVYIEFQQYSYSENIIRQRYQDLKARLQRKYSQDKGFMSAEDDDWESDKNINIFLGTLYSDMRCCLSANYSESQGKDMYYYLILTYFDSSMLEDPDDEL